MHEGEEKGGGGEPDGNDWWDFIEKMVVPAKKRSKKIVHPRGDVLEAEAMVRRAVEELRALKALEGTIPLPSPGVIPEPRPLGVPPSRPGWAPAPDIELFPERVGSVFAALLQAGLESFVGYRPQYETNQLAGALEENLAKGLSQFVENWKLKPVAAGAGAAGVAGGMGFLFNWSARLRKMGGMPSMEEEFGRKAVQQSRGYSAWQALGG